MGNSRESKNIFFFIKSKNYKRAWFLVMHFDKITYEDTIMPIVCKFKGHNAYLSDNEWACKRCHHFLPNYNHLREIRKAKLKKLKQISK